MGLKERLLRLDKKRNVEAGKADVWHSTFYHDHFEGYQEYCVPRKNGRGQRLMRVYVGEYYRHTLDAPHQVLLKLLYIVLFLSSAWACLTGGTLPVASNRVWYVNLPQALALPCLFWVFLGLLIYVPAIRPMKKWTYRFASKSLRTGTIVGGSVLLAVAMAHVAFFCAHTENYGSQALQSPILSLLAGLSILAIGLIERRVSYTVEEGDAPVVPEGVIL